MGDIPAHWEMVYSKKLFFQRKDKAFPEDVQLTSSQKYGIISQQEFMEREGRRVTVVVTGNDILKHVGKGDFVISMRSFQGGLEYSYVDGKISSAYVMIIPNHEKVCDEYFKWLFKSSSYIKALQGTSDLVRDTRHCVMPILPKSHCLRCLWKNKEGLLTILNRRYRK